MQQRQLRLGDILDDYCPRERRVTNHAVVAMVGQDVKQTRCTTCDAEHEYKHAKVPRQRRKADTRAALYSQVLAKGPKRVAHEEAPGNGAARVEEGELPSIDADLRDEAEGGALTVAPVPPPATEAAAPEQNDAAHPRPERDEGPVHRPLIRASLPRADGQPPPELSNPFVQTSREGFHVALDVSTYSLIALTRAVAPLMERRGGGSVLTLTYLGSERVFTNYNVMGVAKAALEASVRYLAANLGPQNIRVNAISAGPIKTLAAAGISGFSNILHVYRERAPLRRNVELSEVADAAVFLLSHAGRAVTGEVLMVDAGFHIIGGA